MSSCCVAEGDRIDGAGVGQPQLSGRLADLRGELLEPGRGRDLQGAQGFVRSDHEGVRPAHREQDEVTGPGVDVCPSQWNRAVPDRT